MWFDSTDTTPVRVTGDYQRIVERKFYTILFSLRWLSPMGLGGTAAMAATPEVRFLGGEL